MTPYLATLIGLAIMGEIAIRNKRLKINDIRRKALAEKSGKKE